MIEKVLIAIDDTPTAMYAADFGIDLAKSLGAKIGVIYVTNYSAGNIDAGITPSEAEKALQQQHDTLMNEIEITHPGIYIKEFDPIGKPETEIQNAIARWQPNMLVIGHRTHSLFQLIFNRDIEKLLINTINIPLLIVPETAMNKQ